jgi:hypothetical protein
MPKTNAGLDVIEIRVTYDADGRVDEMHYEHGCGAFSYRVDPRMALGVVLKEHLQHCDDWHDMRPQVSCDFTIEDTRRGLILRCINKPHETGEHVLRTKG